MFANGFDARRVVLAIDLPFHLGHVTSNPAHVGQLRQNRDRSSPGSVELLTCQTGNRSLDNVTRHPLILLIAIMTVLVVRPDPNGSVARGDSPPFLPPRPKALRRLFYGPPPWHWRTPRFIRLPRRDSFPG